jgi:hypothetical protein
MNRSDVTPLPLMTAKSRLVALRTADKVFRMTRCFEDVAVFESLPTLQSDQLLTTGVQF